jgi:hypothetical protein
MTKEQLITMAFAAAEEAFDKVGVLVNSHDPKAPTFHDALKAARVAAVDLVLRHAKEITE